jgi:hypothetical protein
MKKPISKIKNNKFNIFISIILLILTVSSVGLWLVTLQNKSGIESTLEASMLDMARVSTDPKRNAEFKIVDEDKKLVRIPMHRISLPMNDAIIDSDFVSYEDVENKDQIGIHVTHPRIWKAGTAPHEKYGDSDEAPLFAKFDCSTIRATLRPSEPGYDVDVFELANGDKLEIDKVTKDCKEWYKLHNFDELIKQTIESLKQMKPY